MDPEDPSAAQRIVSEYGTVLEKQAGAGVRPESTATLPYPKEAIEVAIRIVVATLRETGRLTPELRDFLEQAYISLADYVDGEVARLMVEYQQASANLAADGRRGNQQLDAPAWKVVAESGRLVGAIARAIAAETDARRREFGGLLK